MIKMTHTIMTSFLATIILIVGCVEDLPETDHVPLLVILALGRPQSPDTEPTDWAQEAYLKAPNVGPGDEFGYSVSIDGETIAVGAYKEDSNQTFITNGSGANIDNSIINSGAVFVF